MIYVKSEEEIKIMQEGGRILNRILQKIKHKIKSGISTKEIDEIALNLMSEESVKPAFKDYKGFIANICTSVNEEVVHGIPNEKCILKDGDILSMDVGIIFQGYYSDAAITLPVGRIDPSKRKLIQITREALYQGIKQAKVNNHVSDISYAIQKHVEAHGFSVVRKFVGHGIGRQMHEEPEVPNFGLPHNGALLKKGMVLAIEPMVNMGTWDVEIADNGWTAVTKDRLPSAHFEHTVAITENGPQILTC